MGQDDIRIDAERIARAAIAEFVEAVRSRFPYKGLEDFDADELAECEAAALEAMESDGVREEAFERYSKSGARGMGDLDLRAAAQHAQAIGDSAAERELNDTLASRGSR